ncbi:hypothetical protein PG984_009234 [Apiospora sp. TS-2023a]
MTVDNDASCITAPPLPPFITTYLLSHQELGAKPYAAKRVVIVEVTEEAGDDSGEEGPLREDLPTTVVVAHTASLKK